MVSSHVMDLKIGGAGNFLYTLQFDRMSTRTIAGFILWMYQDSFDENSLVPIPRPPFSPDSAASDFWHFGHIKASFQSVYSMILISSLSF
jgi:hypothetical protein